MRLLRIAGIALAALGVGLALAWARWIRVPPLEAPAVSGVLVDGALRVDGRRRTFQAYVPARRTAAPALVFVLHGSMGDGAQARASTYHAFEPIADREGFVVVYPDGWERHWNGCRAGAPYAANTEDVDDVAFFAAMVAHFEAELGADPERVFATGLSNGGHMAYRLALEAPERVAAVAPVAASLPTDANLGCSKSGRPAAVLVINGTADPMNPYAGGEAALYGIFFSRGDVLSSDATVEYFAGLAGHRGPPRIHAYPDVSKSDDSTAELRVWEDGPGPPVALLRVKGGGHSFPNPRFRFPRFLGPTNADIDAAQEIWRFFTQSSGRPAPRRSAAEAPAEVGLPT
jgi:polyhydroxybutyrate depolymerase